MAIGDLSSVTERYNSEVDDAMRAATTGRTIRRRLRNAQATLSCPPPYQLSSRPR
jgi:hypothetical protein